MESIVQNINTEIEANGLQAELLSTSDASALYGPDTFYSQRSIDGVLIPHNVDAVMQIMTLANQLGFHLHPVSSNKNWGYGGYFIPADKAPERFDFVLDLAKLNEIEPTDPEAGLITLGPGVTQAQLADYLEQNNWNYMAPVTGAGPHASIVSNAVERGYGITPHSDHFYAVTALKAVLPHPDFCQTLYQSALSELDGSGTDFIDKTYKWGLGPYIDGLFTQSNLGVVTQMTVRLARKPSHFSSFYIRVEDKAHFSNAVKFVRYALEAFAGSVAAINLMDRRRLISITADNPNLGKEGKVLSDVQVEQISSKKRLPEWMIVGSIYGEPEMVKAIQSRIRIECKSVGKCIFSDSKRLSVARWLFNSWIGALPGLRSVRQQLASMKEGTDVMLGKPNQVALPLPYWANPRVKADKSKTLLPDKDGCGLLWYAPLVKMSPESMSALSEHVRGICVKHGIDPFVTFTNLKHDCLDASIPIVFDRDDVKQKAAAHACLKELIEEGLTKGFVPYRLPVMYQQTLNGDVPFWKTAGLLKKAIDPNHVLSPERYNPPAQNV